MLIRIMHLTTTHRSPAHREARVLPIARVKLGVGGRLAVRSDAQEGPERREGKETAVESKSELVEVRLEMLRRDAVGNANQPRLEIREHEVNQGQPFLSYVGVPFLCDRLFREIEGLELAVGGPVVRDDVRARRNGHAGEANETLGGSVRHDGQPQAPGISAATARNSLALLTEDILFGARPLALADLDGANDEGLVMGALPLAARLAAHPCLVQLHGVDAADHVDVSAHHAGPRRAEDLVGGLVAVEPELALELDGRHAGRERSHEVGAPEPRQQRCVAVLHDGAGGQPRLLLACPTAQDVRARGDASGLPDCPATRAGETTRPADALHVGGAVRVVRKELLELRETPWEWKLAHVLVVPLVQAQLTMLIRIMHLTTAHRSPSHREARVFPLAVWTPPIMSTSRRTMPARGLWGICK